jgi:3-oxoadipate enol-lactonase
VSVVDVHHVVEGPQDAPVVVLGNSLGTSLAMWQPVAGMLRERRRVVRYDHRGQGDSPVPPGPYDIADLGRDMLALLDALGIERAAYCGVSIGGMVGLWLAANAPERLDALVACCTSAHPGNAPAWAERAAVVTAAAGTAPIVDAVVAGWTTPAFAAAHPEVAAQLRAMLLASPPAGYAACCGVLERLDLRDALPEIVVPTLIVGGAQDAALPPDHGERIAAAIPGARFALLDPAAHIPMVERPGAVTDLILEHLEIPA